MKLALLRAAMRRCTSVVGVKPAQARILPRGAPLRQVQYVPLSLPNALTAEPPPSAPLCPLSRSTSGIIAAELPRVNFRSTPPRPSIFPPLRTPSPRRKAKITRTLTPQFPSRILSQNARIIFLKSRLLTQTLVLPNISTRTDICEHIYRNSSLFSTYIFPPKPSKNVSEYILGKLSAIFFVL